MSSPVPLSKNRSYIVFLCGQTASYIGDAVLLVALPLLVLDTTGSVAAMGMVTATTGAGQLAGGLLAGPVADRFDRRRVLLACDLARVLLYAAIPACWLAGLHAMAVVYAVALLGGGLGTLYFVTRLATLPSLADLDASQLTAANGHMMAGYGLALLVGPLLGGLLSSLAGAAVAIGLDAATFAIAAATVAVLRLRPAPADAGHDAASDPRDLLAGVRFAWRQPVLRAVLLLVVGAALLMAPANDLLVYHLETNLGVGDRGIGAVLAVAALGAIASGVFAASARARLGFGPALLAMFAVQGGCIIAIGAVGSAPPIAAATAGYAFGATGCLVYTNAIRQQLTPSALLGRVTAVFSVLTSAVGPIGALAGTWLAARAGAPDVMILGGCGFLALAAAGAWTAAGRHRDR